MPSFPFKDLREFIKELEKRDELIRITEEVSCELEITEITDRISKSKDLKENKALLFENVKGYEMPVLINSMGSFDRLKLALGVKDLDEIAQRIEKILDPSIPDGLLNKVLKFSDLAKEVLFMPKLVSHSKAPCQEIIIKNIEKSPEKMLDKLPILKCWTEDAGKFITLPLVFTKDPRTGTRNVGMYRLQKFSNNTTGFHVHWHHDAAYNNISSNRLPVAVAIGCDPALVYAATAPLPKGIDETIFAGFLRKSPVELVKCQTIDMEVPANAEIILEGYVHLDELVTEGPFGDHTGFYSLADLFPVFHLTAMTHRKDPVYMTTIVGKPPQEDCYLGKATERIFLPLLQKILPEVIDINLPWEGVFHSCVLVKIKKTYPGQAQKVMNALWGSGQMSLSKCIIVFDEEVNIQDVSEAAWRAFNNVDPIRDILLTKGPLDILDHASELKGFGGKIGIDATKKLEGEGFRRNWPDEITMSLDIKELVSSKWERYFKNSKDKKEKEN